MEQPTKFCQLSRPSWKRYRFALLFNFFASSSSAAARTCEARTPQARQKRPMSHNQRRCPPKPQDRKKGVARQNDRTD